MEQRIGLDDLKKIQIDILNEVVKFCDENNIRYWLDSGTLLGSIRHKGYIPWDDDIDVGMLRCDYEKFLNTFNKYNDRYKAYSIENNRKFYYPFCKVLDTKTVLYEPDKKALKLSVNIDIFPYDNVPNDGVTIKRILDIRDFNRKCFTIKCEKIDKNRGIVKNVILFLRKMALLPFPKGFFIMNMVRNAKQYESDDQSSQVGLLVGFTRSHCDKDVFDKFSKAEFEGEMYNVPGGYDKWLRAFYGDYMQLPPKEEQVSHHTFEAYRLK